MFCFTLPVFTCFPKVFDCLYLVHLSLISLPSLVYFSLCFISVFSHLCSSPVWFLISTIFFSFHFLLCCLPLSFVIKACFCFSTCLSCCYHIWVLFAKSITWWQLTNVTKQNVNKTHCLVVV